MGGFLSFKVAPGVRISASSRGLRGHVGPRAARVHIGGGRTGVSTGAGPFTAYQSITGASRPRSSGRTSTGLTPAQAERQRQVDVAAAEFARLESLHRRTFSGPERERVTSPPLPRFGRLLATAEKQSLRGVGWSDRPARREARAEARVTAERWAADLLLLAEETRRAQQDVVDARWEALMANDIAAVTSVLGQAFAAAGSVRVAGVYGDEIGLVVTVPGPAAIPDRKPAATPAGGPRLRQLTKTERNEWYAQLVAAHLLLTAKQAFAHAPGLQAVRLVAVDASGTSLLGARTLRDSMLRADWSRAAWSILWDAAPGLRHEVRGRTRELVTVDLRQDDTFAPVLRSPA